MEIRRIYVKIGEHLASLDDSQRQIREIAFSVMRDAGIAMPDIRTTASARCADDEEDEFEAPRQATLTMRFVSGEDDAAIRDLVNKVRAALLVAGLGSFDPRAEESRDED